MSEIRRAVLVALLLTCAACGQKGPLFVPGYGKNTPWPIPQAGVVPPGGAVTSPAPRPSDGGESEDGAPGLGGGPAAPGSRPQ